MRFENPQDKLEAAERMASDRAESVFTCLCIKPRNIRRYLQLLFVIVIIMVKITKVSAYFT
jgi:hypothetical protein